MREKLMKLIDELPPHEGKTFEEALADHLIANGVTIVETPKPKKMLCINWNPGHHGLNQHCEWMQRHGNHRVCSCNGDYDKCDYSR